MRLVELGRTRLIDRWPNGRACADGWWPTARSPGRNAWPLPPAWPIVKRGSIRRPRRALAAPTGTRVRPGPSKADHGGPIEGRREYAHSLAGQDVRDNWVRSRLDATNFGRPVSMGGSREEQGRYGAVHRGGECGKSNAGPVRDGGRPSAGSPRVALRRVPQDSAIQSVSSGVTNVAVGIAKRGDRDWKGAIQEAFARLASRAEQVAAQTSGERRRPPLRSRDPRLPWPFRPQGGAMSSCWARRRARCAVGHRVVPSFHGQLAAAHQVDSAPRMVGGVCRT